ncbi:hypothetical protein Zmor_025682 [Zophobas morio]|uniref:Uncharacterized protein n=1 Tax=Zophobas morio TaxID=2755281 RepID=A0AA38M5C7_9CUCU|nr:hypothetical protein Zmor_025682 [Zophobas morio]
MEEQVNDIGHFNNCNEANFRGPETMTRTARVHFGTPACFVPVLESPPLSEKPCHRHRVFFDTVGNRNRRARVVTVTALSSRVAVPSSCDFQISRSPPPEPGGARLEGSHSPGGTTVPDI